MPACSAYGCTRRSEHGEISFHRFPKDPGLRAKWIRATRREKFNPSKSAGLCSRHFLAEDLEKKSKNIRVKKDSVPSVFPEFPSHLQRQPRKPRKSAKVVDSQCSGIDSTFTIIYNVPNHVMTPPLRNSNLSLVTSHSHTIKPKERQYDEIKKEMSDADDIELSEQERTNFEAGSNVEVISKQSIQNTQISDSLEIKTEMSDADDTELSEQERTNFETGSNVEIISKEGTQNTQISDVEIKTEMLDPDDIELSEQERTNFEAGSNVVVISKEGTQNTQTSDSLEKVLLKQKLKETEDKLLLSKKKIKTLLQKNRRLGKRYAKLKTIVNDLKKKSLQSTSSLNVVEDSAVGVIGLLQRQQIQISAFSSKLNTAS